MICAALLATVALLATATQETTEVQVPSPEKFRVGSGKIRDFHGHPSWSIGVSK